MRFLRSARSCLKYSASLGDLLPTMPSKFDGAQVFFLGPKFRWCRIRVAHNDGMKPEPKRRKSGEGRHESAGLLR